MLQITLIILLAIGTCLLILAMLRVPTGAEGNSSSSY
jgi:hypothetical protein